MFSLPLVDDDHTSNGVPPLETTRIDTPDVELSLKEIEVKDDSDSAETEVMGGRTSRKEDPSTASTADLFLERLSASSRSSLNGSDHMEEDLAELGIYDSELLAEDAATGSESEDDDDWDELEMGRNGDSASPMIGLEMGGRVRRKRKKWKEAEEELQRGGNRSLAEVRRTVYLFARLSNHPFIIASRPDHTGASFGSIALDSSTTVFLPTRWRRALHTDIRRNGRIVCLRTCCRGISVKASELQPWSALF